LEDKDGKIVLISAVILTIMISIFMAINIQSIFEQAFGSIVISEDMNPEELTELFNTYSQKIGELSAFSVIHNLVMLLAFFMAYKHINSDDFKASMLDKSFSSAESVKDEWYCPHCGRAVPSDANICPYCGKQM
jgi:rubrerythrin